jgi:hypothetical protein
MAGEWKRGEGERKPTVFKQFDLCQILDGAILCPAVVGKEQFLPRRRSLGKK